MSRPLVHSFRFAVLTSLGLLHACSGDDGTGDSNAGAESLGPMGPTTPESGPTGQSSEPQGDDVEDDDVPIDVAMPMLPTGDDDLATDDDATADDDIVADDDLGLDDDQVADDDVALDDDIVSDDDVAGDDDMAADDDLTPDDDLPADDDISSDDDIPSDDDVSTDDDVENPACPGDMSIGDGLAQCGDVTHRVEPVTCTSELPRDRVLEGESDYFACRQDADCTDQPHGRCELWDPALNQIGEPGSSCTYGCVTDSDCFDGFVCECASPVGQCVQANDCETDAECPENSLCARYQYFDGCGDTIGYGCTSTFDECTTNADCAEATECAWTAEGRRCMGQICAVGRPFLVDGVARLANVVRRDDWQRAIDLDVTALSVRERTDLGRAWASVGLMEHASIAAFARFSLQLMAVAAPPHLLEQTQQALEDETEHAKMAFGVASAFRGEAIGPTELDLGDAPLETELRAVVLNTVLEGCIGESVAAVEARAAGERTEDANLRSVLEQIAADEQRHAQLAFDFVAWALSEEPALAAEVAALVQEQHRRAEQAAIEDGDCADPEAWMHAYGISSDARRRLLRADVLRHAVLPCISALCASVQPPRGVIEAMSISRLASPIENA